MPIHDIVVNEIGAGRLDPSNLVTELGEVGGKNRWSNLQGAAESATWAPSKVNR